MQFNGIVYRKAGGTLNLIKSVNGFCAIESAKLEEKWQDGGKVTLVLTTTEVLTFYAGDYILVKDRPFLVETTISEYTTEKEGLHKYTVEFLSPDYLLRNALIYNTVEEWDGTGWVWARPYNFLMEFGSIHTLVEAICYNANEVAGERLFKVGEISSELDDEDYRAMSYSDGNCWAALKQSCEEFDTFYTIRFNTDAVPDSKYIIDIGIEPTAFPTPLSVGRNGGLVDLTLDYSDSDVYTQFIVMGSTENLPRGYPHERLQLEEDLSADPPVYAGSLIALPDKYTQWGKKRMELILDDIKPTRTANVTGVPTQNIFAFFDTSLAELTAADPYWSPIGGSVHFLSGNLMGYTFSIIGFHPGTCKITIKQIVDSNEFKLPNDDPAFQIKPGMLYNLAGIAMPEQYVITAQERLKAQAIEAIEYYSQPRAALSMTPSPFYLEEKQTEIVAGMPIPVKHAPLGIDREIRVTEVSYDLLQAVYHDLDSVSLSDITNRDSFLNATHKATQRSLNILREMGVTNPITARELQQEAILNNFANSLNLPDWTTLMDLLGQGKGLFVGINEEGEDIYILNADLMKVTVGFINQLFANEVFIGNFDSAAEDLVNNYIVHLSLPVISVSADADGAIQGAIPTSTVTIYHGTKVDSGWTFSAQFTNCTGSITAGVVTLTNITDKSGKVKITATKTGKPTLTTEIPVLKVYQGADGDDGKDGDDGVSITGVTNYYQRTKTTTAPASWQETVPTLTSEYKYLWNYEKITYSSGSPTTTTPAIIGVYGDTGSTGKGISSITEYYAIHTSNSVAPTSWETTVQATTLAKPYLWNYEKITYTDGSTTDTKKRVIGTHGATGDTGADAVLYGLTISPDVVTRNLAGVVSSVITCSHWKVVGNGIPVASTKTLKFKRASDTTESDYTAPVAVGTSAYVDFILYDGSTVLVKRRVMVVADLAEWRGVQDDYAKFLGYEGGYSEMATSAKAKGKLFTQGGYISADMVDVDALVAQTGLVGKLFANQAYIGEFKDLTDKSVRIGGVNLFDYSQIGVYSNGVITPSIPPIRLTTQGYIRSVGDIFLLTGENPAYTKTGSIISARDVLVGCKIDIRRREELLIYGYTDLETLTIKYKIDGGAEVIETKPVENGKFKFPLIVSGNELSLGIGGAGKFELDEVMVVHGNKEVDFQLSDNDVLDEASQDAEKLTSLNHLTQADQFAKLMGFAGLDYMIDEAKRGNTLIVGGYLRNQMIDTKALLAETAFVEDLFANTAFIGVLDDIDELGTMIDTLDGRIASIVGGDTALDSMAELLGYDNYADMLAKGELSGTLIYNGYIRTSIIDAEAVIASLAYIEKQLRAGDVLIGLNVMGTDKHGIKIDDDNYWWRKGGVSPTFEFRVGSSEKYLRYDSNGIKYTGDLDGASGTFAGNVNVGGIKIGKDVKGTGWDGFYINANNYWKGDGSTFRFGGSSQYIEFVNDQLNLTVPLTVEKVAVGGIVLGQDAYDTGLHGIKIDSHNYWYLDGSGVFKVGDSTNYMQYSKYGSNWRLEIKGDITGSTGAFAGKIDVGGGEEGGGVKIGKDACGTGKHGISVNDDNYWWYKTEAPTGFGFKVGAGDDYLEVSEGAMEYKGALVAQSGKIGDLNITTTKVYTGSSGTFGALTTPFYVDATTFSLADKLKLANGLLEISADGKFTGTVEAGSIKIGSKVSKTGSADNHGIFINDYNYWYGTGLVKMGANGKTLSYNGTDLIMDGGKITGGSFETSKGNVKVTISPSVLTGSVPGIKLVDTTSGLNFDTYLSTTGLTISAGASSQIILSGQTTNDVASLKTGTLFLKNSTGNSILSATGLYFSNFLNTSPSANYVWKDGTGTLHHGNEWEGFKVQDGGSYSALDNKKIVFIT